MKKILLPIMVAVLVLGGLGAGALQSDIKTTDSNAGVENASKTIIGDERVYTHTVFAEFGTEMGCQYCPYAHAALKQIYAGGWHPFYYVSLVAYSNTHANQRLGTDYNIAGFPTTYFDGGYLVRVGAYQTVPQMVSWYNSSIVSSGNRAAPDITADVSASWQGDATMNIQVSVQNNEANRYAGRIRVYVTEIASTMGWHDVWGYPYTFAFLDYAFNQDLSINPGDTWQDSTSWNGNLHNDGYGHTFGGITANNIMVIAAVFNATGYPRFSDPPNNPFTAYFVDETVGSLVSTGVDPGQSFVILTNENLPHLITCPAGDAPVYQNLKVTCKDGSGTPMPGIPASAFTFTLGSINAVWYGTLSCTFTAVDPQTDANGEIRFTVKGDTSIYGNMTIQATVQGVPLNDIDTLPCKSVDYDVNGQVSLGDFVTFASDYTKTSWRSDFSGDGQVTLGDFVTFAGHYTH